MLKLGVAAADLVTVRRSSQARRGRWALLALVGCAAAACTGCGGRASSSAPLVRISERDFRISAPRHVRAGTVALRFANRGPDTHELIVVRSAAGESLPLRSDGLTVDEEALEDRTAIKLEGLTPGGTEEKSVTLAPGRYVVFCNMAGHYLGGMRATIQVR